jgi:hypothetical protein
MEEWIYNPNQSYGLDSNAYDLGGSGNNYNTVSYTPSYGGTGDYNVGGSGGSGGSFDTVSYDLGGGYGGDFGRVSQGGGGGGGGGGGAWWDTPSFTPSFTQQYSAPMFTPTYSLGEGTGTNMFSMGNTGVGAQAGGGSFGAATTGQGNFGGVTVGGGGFGAGSFSTTPASSSGSTPAFGVSPNTFAQDDEIDRGTVLENSLNTAQNVVGSGLSTVKDKVGGALSAVDDYARTNPMGARLGLEGAGMLIGAYNQRAANKEARRVNDMQARDRENLRALQAEQMQMQREMYERSNQQLERNNQLADQFNTQATQSVNEARSLYNPQEMAIRAMAQQQMGTQNLITAGERDMRRRGMSDAAIAAETRRARLGGTTGATTAYTKGLDVGRQAQQSALTSAKGLSQQYGGVGAAPALTTNLGGDANYTLANTLSKSGADTTANLKALLNLYLGDPITRSDQEIRRQTQKESVK